MNKHHGLRDMFQPADNATRTMRELISGTEALLRSTASYGGSEIESARDSLKHQLEAAREHAKGWERAAWDRARHASHAADEYVHENAWKSLAGAALIGVLAGVCLMSDHKRR
ncbi:MULTISPECIES: ElaB/YgaM/YqjD family protein [Achromobacter]|jgi:ElaB/YqjD/DUF883 family membrane-anchored ribosome-binding protein|uniref:Bacterial protein of uncharacterized function (DUF883) n=1 Tax=Achromobacter aegrifaciens TaxID=1287736 RepID=A0AAD2IZX5_ACHAE|nr:MULTISPECIES: DUF883 family protein [Achromobacter]PTN50268.1 DUF883 domain-containing protein [Achromobacter xylosoxidans]MBD9380262.1 DUF883 domain-containing protein [Achromobacter sp. ACM02]MBD9418635.1 DUF883 domain-containing protein [Achromobacter sp. ACM04]MBD9429022.1 DUF883 domain-containing protein [Achromobacter sp. ACM03]MBD9473714.1 DUF883 domain-containing protein [Achromobacter sp. ACM01]